MNKQRKQPNRSNQLNLENIFKSVAGSLNTQKENLNNADTFNHDHGDNMVEVFNVISQAMQEKKNADLTDQLAYASQLLKQRKSGSAQLYAQGLSQASKEFIDQQLVTPNNAINLIQALLGGDQPSSNQSQSQGVDLLGSLLGAGTAPTQQRPDGVGDLLSTILGRGNRIQQSQNQQASSSLDAGDLLNTGMAFMSTKSKGGNDVEAIVNALVSGSPMGNSQHRSQSAALVVNSLLQAISGMSGKK